MGFLGVAFEFDDVVGLIIVNKYNKMYESVVGSVRPS